MFNYNSIEDLETMGDYLDELQIIQDYAAFEADMATNPYDDPWLV